MKNLLLLSTCFLLLALASSAQKSVSTPQLSGDFIKKIGDATPAPLSQTGQRKKTTDAEDLRLKGKVKSVTEELEDLSGTWEAQGRHFWWIADFDERGDFVRRVAFDNRGYPMNVQAYGYVDGVRASKYGDVKGRNTITGGPPPGVAPPTVKKRDERFTYKYEYVYSSAGLIEMRYMHSDGDPGNRVTYERKGTQIEEIIYDQAGARNRGYVRTFDEKGNEIEEQAIRGSSSRFPARGETRRFKYETFDKTGNWTKRITLKAVNEDGKESYKPSSITYRTISYY
jgi:hypothetical protein